MKEAGLTCDNMSVYGAFVQKLPESFVSKVAAMKKNPRNAKTSKYVFQGSLEMNNPRRQWILDFVRANFAKDDLLIITDEDNHSSLGPYDHTASVVGYSPRHHKPDQRHFFFDGKYYALMIKSDFTLSPGGDCPWSMRFYEAILAGSIPVINSVGQDYSGRAFWFNRIGYRYFTIDQAANSNMSRGELKRIADENYNLLLKYQTWIQGDLVPPQYNAYSEACHSNDECRRLCATVEA